MAGISEDLTSSEWIELQNVFGFIGNELLRPMNRSRNYSGLDPDFWRFFPVYGSAAAENGLRRLSSFAAAAGQAGDLGFEDPDVPGMMSTSVEYARLFIGPPAPAANPWESSYDPGSDAHMGFGRATLQLQTLLREDGFVVDGEGSQFADHIGIELLYLSFLCEKASEGGKEAVAKARWFAASHPGKWLGGLREKVDSECPDGYYSALLQFANETIEDVFM